MLFQSGLKFEISRSFLRFSGWERIPCFCFAEPTKRWYFVVLARGRQSMSLCRVLCEWYSREWPSSKTQGQLVSWGGVTN